MNCFICEHSMSPFFFKKFTCYNLGEVHYWKCNFCGFVISKTHKDMSRIDLENLNYAYHSSYLGKETNPDDPRWINRLSLQALTISKLTDLKILSTKLQWVDHGCGDGKLVDILGSLNIVSYKFDRYMAKGSKYLSHEELLKNQYDLVISTSVFEHVTSISPLEEIFNLVADTGALALHVLVRDEIPQDPNWFYLLPVHSAFYTNRSMKILFEKYLFKSSLYHVPSRMWFWFKDYRDEIEKKLHKGEPNKAEWFYKRGFMDYWK